MKKTDVLIIGSGIAGLSFAIKMAGARPDLLISVLTKSNNETSNTFQAQGGIAVVLNKIEDSFEEHIKDTLKAGKGLCDKKVVEMVVRQAPERLQELIGWGTEFDTNSNGKLSLSLEGGHSRHRIVHHQDFTGLEIAKKLYEKACSFSNISFFDYYFVTDLMMDEESGKQCVGAYAFDKQKKIHVSINSKITFLATGGSGMIFQNTTNPSVATGDGVAIAYRAGAYIENMNFFQFHPTALYEKNRHPLFLISEAVRGFGSYLVNHSGNRFLFRTDVRGELATRDVVSKAIAAELKQSREECVYLDCRHLDYEAFKQHFPTIVSTCSDLGLNLKIDLIPVVPAAHYQCGGIWVDTKARTSVKNLYASGECAHTGLHGANRLASNSLLEALVFSHQAAQSLLQEIDEISVVRGQEKSFPGESKKCGDKLVKNLRKKLNQLMNYNSVSTPKIPQKNNILCELRELDWELRKLESVIMATPAYFELKNMLQVAMLVMEHAIDNRAVVFPIEN